MELTVIYLIGAIVAIQISDFYLSDPLADGLRPQLNIYQDCVFGIIPYDAEGTCVHHIPR